MRFSQLPMRWQRIGGMFAERLLPMVCRRHSLRSSTYGPLGWWHRIVALRTDHIHGVLAMKNAIRGCSFCLCLFEESLQLCDQLEGSQLHRQHCLFCVIGCLAQRKDTFDHAGGVVCCQCWTVYFPDRITSVSSSLLGSSGWMFSGRYQFLGLECAASSWVEHPNNWPFAWQSQTCRSQRFSWNLDWQLRRWGHILLEITARAFHLNHAAKHLSAR